MKAKEEVKKEEPEGGISRIEKVLLKSFGEKSVTRLSELAAPDPISTGSLRLDLALSEPFPAGIHTIYGTRGAGKTTLVLETLAQCQAKKNLVIPVYINMERAINKSIAATVDKLQKEGALLANPKTAEECGDIAEQVLKSLSANERALIAIDSVAAMLPEAIASEPLEKSTMGKDAKIVTTMLRKLSILASDTNSVVLLVNQTRQNLTGYGPKIILPGGDALQFFSTQIIYLSLDSNLPYGKRVDQEGKIFGRVVKAEVQKNRWTTPFVSVPVPFYFGKGIDRSYEIAQLLIELGVAEQKGSWVTVGKTKDVEEIKVQGIEKLADIIRADPKLEDGFKRLILSSYTTK